jgi:hypothetical protein
MSVPKNLLVTTRKNDWGHFHDFVKFMNRYTNFFFYQGLEGFLGVVSK